MRRSGRTTKAIEAYRALAESSAVFPVFVAANGIEVKRIEKLIGPRSNVQSIESRDFNRETGEILGYNHDTPYVFDHYACECLAEKIEEEIKALRIIQERYRKLARKF